MFYRYSEIALKLPHMIEVISKKDWIIYSNDFDRPKHEVNSEVRRWLKENIQNYTVGEFFDAVWFKFDSEEDAILFKLTWC
jgi:hypothetical protein